MCLSLSQKVIRVFRMHRNVLNTRETFIVYVSFFLWGHMAYEPNATPQHLQLNLICMPIPGLHCICILWFSSHTGHSVKFQNCLNSWWRRFNKVLETFLKNLWSTLTWHHHTIAADFSDIHPRWESPEGALLGWDLVTGGDLSTINSLSCSRNHFEFQPASRRWIHCGHEGMDMVSHQGGWGV